MSGEGKDSLVEELIPLKAGLAKLARLLDEFTSDIRVWRGAIGETYDKRWKELRGDSTASLTCTLDGLLLNVFEHQLVFLSALKQIFLEEVYGDDESDPFGLLKQANQFRSKADMKLLYLEEQIKQLKMSMGLTEHDPDEEVFALSVGETAPAPVAEQPISEAMPVEEEAAEAPDKEPSAAEAEAFEEPVTTAQHAEERPEASTATPEEVAEEQVTSTAAVDLATTSEAESPEAHEEQQPQEQVEDETILPPELSLPDDEAYAAARTAAFEEDALETDAAVVELQQAEASRVEEEQPPIESVVTTDEVLPPEPVISIEELQAKVDALRQVHRSEADLRINTKEGPETLSLQYFNVSNGAGEATALLDIGSFVDCHRKAISGALRMTAGLDGNGNSSRRNAVLRRLQHFLRELYANVRKIAEPQGEMLLPYTGNRIDSSVLYNFEAKLNMDDWDSNEDIEDFLAMFKTRLDGPFAELLDDPEEKRKYLESIVTAASE